MSASHHGLDNLIAIVDFNNQQADGPSTQMLCSEPLEAKRQAFGWHTQRVDANDIEAVRRAFDAARDCTENKPRLVICDTQMCKGIPFLEAREKTHFIRVEPHEWELALTALDGGDRHEAVETPTTHAGAWTGSSQDVGHDRIPFGHALCALAEQRADIVGMTADLSKYTDLHVFAAKYPDHFFQMGMVESTMRR